MKRCPQCEFIYEDDQSHCDMDGTRLIHDAQKLPKLQALNTTTSVDKPKARSRLVALVATLVLAGVMALVYYVSIRHAPRATAVAIPPIIVDAAQPKAEVSPAPQSEVVPASQPADSEKAPAETSNNRARTAETPSVADPKDSKSEAKPSPKTDSTSATKATSQTRTAASTTAKTEGPDDKVKSALKKTGRFFKKAIPF